jgi:hypothetical protein
LPSLFDNVNPDMPSGDRIDNKRILRSPAGMGSVSSRKEVLGMRLVSPRIQLAAVAVGAVVAAALLGGCPWGP